MYVACIFEHLNKLNLSCLQGKKIDIFVSLSKVNAIKKKLSMWQNRVASNNSSDFALLRDSIKEHGSNFQEQLLPLIEAHFDLLQENLEKYFNAEQNAIFDANCWVLQPFTSDMPSTDPEDLIDLQTDFDMKALFKEIPYTDYWVHLLKVPEYRSLAEKAVAMLILMPRTYLCESAFSCLCEIKSGK